MNALIHITGTQTVDDEQDVTELTTNGTLTPTTDGWELRYAESEATGLSGSETTLEITENKLNLIRTGSHPSMLVLEKNRRHHCNYNTPYGTIDLGTYTSELRHSLSEHGGEIYFSYTLGFNGGISSAHVVHISVQEEK
ncbi:MAG: DUF1934 domain-containing protein [Clostridia bacterium]|nr:DUF1934 domain-containing protein [Clostridia bacterium]